MKKSGLFADRRFGGAGVVVLVIIVLLVVAAAGGGYWYYSQGKTANDNQTKLIDDGYKAFVERNFDKAYQNFDNASGTFNAYLDFYHKFSDEKPLTKKDLREVMFALSMYAAYDDLFILSPESKWVDRADKILDEMEAENDPENPVDFTEYESLLSTLKSCEELCKLYSEEEYEDAFKKLLKVEKSALSGDKDFFIFEIRFMIASARALEEPLIIKKARELLFIMTKAQNEEEEKDIRIDALWDVLRSGSN